MNKKEILKNVDKLVNMYKKGLLGGEVMPEDRLRIITEQELNSSNVQLIVIERWNEILKGTKYNPINIHTPMWLWSRNGFKELE